MKFTLSGEVAGRLREKAERVVLEVADTGVGIPAEELPRVFDRFYRVAGNRGRTHEGSGIGLALVRELVALHGGTVSVASEGLQRGSVFTIRLPLSKALPAAPARGVTQGQAPDANAALQRVLIADDNIDALDTLAAMFEVSGYSVRKCPDGMQAIQEALAWRPQFMLLDIGMPLVNGYEVARRIRTETWGAEPMLIAISGWSQPHERERALAAGFNAHFAKPVGFDDLVTAMKASPQNAALAARSGTG